MRTGARTRTRAAARTEDAKEGVDGRLRVRPLDGRARGARNRVAPRCVAKRRHPEAVPQGSGRCYRGAPGARTSRRLLGQRRPWRPKTTTRPWLGLDTASLPESGAIDLSRGVPRLRADPARPLSAPWHPRSAVLRVPWCSVATLSQRCSAPVPSSSTTARVW